MAIFACLRARKIPTVVESLYRPGDARIEQAYLSPAADFSRCDKLMASPIEIYFPEDAPKPSEDLGRRRCWQRDVGVRKIANGALI